MKNWQVLEGFDYEKVWGFINGSCLFRPYSKANRKVVFPNPYICYDVSNFFGKEFKEEWYVDLHLSAIVLFSAITNDRLWAMSWQHECYSFDPRLPFEKDEFDDWFIPFLPNGDYNFFVTKDFKNVVFGDGVSERIWFHGKNIITELERNKPPTLVRVV